jgi:photosystem II stability/assembly factor-like uncharacterized protein
MRLIRRHATTAAIAASLTACGQPSTTQVSLPAPAEPVNVVPSETVVTTSPTQTAPEAVELADHADTGAGAAASAASRFAAWGAVHALIGSPVRIGHSISGQEAIALTVDNLVGVTTNGGASWGFSRHDNGVVLAIGGKAAGPFFAVGKAGYAAMSADGRVWQNLPRYTNEDLIAVAVGSAGAVAVAKSGGFFVHYGSDGRSGYLGAFPDKLKAKAVTSDGTRFSAQVGKFPLVSSDGRSWSLSDVAQVAPLKAFPTSQGVCAPGKVEKATGVVCEVKGQGFGTSAGTVVLQKNVVFTSTNGGNSWNTGAAPFAAFNGVVAAGTNLVAFGNAGAVASSADGGRTWNMVATDVPKSLRAAFVEGTTVVLVGDGGAILRSTDGGASFATVVSPQTGALKQIGKVADGRLIASLGAKGIESTDGGATWVDMADPTALAELAPPAKPGKCDARMPAAGEVCAVQKTTLSPTGLPNVRGLTMQGDNGLAWGDFGLVMTTSTGGASWTAQSGFAVKGLQAFEVRGDVVLGISGKDVILSKDGGKSFSRHLLPKTAGTIWNAHISLDGKVLYGVGQGGTIVRAFTDAPDGWVQLDVGNVAGGGKKVTANLLAVHELGSTPEAGGILFATGIRGELFRSDNRGDSWTAVATGTPQPIQAMAMDGQTTVAVTHAERAGGNLLLKSDDGGLHFHIAREVSHSGQVDVLTLAGGTLTYRDRVSTDFGATWTKPEDSKYWGGAEPVDESGLRIVNHASRYVRDTVYLVGPEKDDWVIMDGIQTRLARFECAASGCWMLHAGQIYRPL